MLLQRVDLRESISTLGILELYFKFEFENNDKSFSLKTIPSEA